MRTLSQFAQTSTSQQREWKNCLNEYYLYSLISIEDLAVDRCTAKQDPLAVVYPQGSSAHK
jgi:hypothetical protein